jgi:hypothetical protein
MNKIKFFLFASLMITMVIERPAFAQCGCIIDNFGSPSGGCTGQITTSPYVPTVNYAYYTGSGQFQDGKYQVACDGSNGFNFGWYGGASGTFASDHTTGSGNFLMVNGSTGKEFYHRTLTGLCTNTSYSIKFSVANASRYDGTGCYYGNLPEVSAYVFPSGTAVQSSAFSGTGGTLLGTTPAIGCGTSTTNPTWNNYSYSFTTGSSQTSLDLILVSVFGDNAGYDYYVDDISFIKSSGSCTITPVTLMSFTAEKTPQNVLLKWSTASEVNFSHFVVERSTDAINFYQLGIVYGSGESKHKIDYTYADNSDNQGIVYYRLKQVDIDGSFKYSPVSSVNVDITSPVFIYPSDGDLTIQFTTKGEATYTIIDMMGKTIYSGNRTSNESLITVSKSNFRTGIYIVKVQMGAEMVTKKIILN